MRRDSDLCLPVFPFFVVALKGGTPWWRHMAVKTCQTTGKWTVCVTVYSCDANARISMRLRAYAHISAHAMRCQCAHFHACDAMQVRAYARISANAMRCDANAHMQCDANVRNSMLGECAHWHARLCKCELQGGTYACPVLHID